MWCFFFPKPLCGCGLSDVSYVLWSMVRPPQTICGWRKTIKRRNLWWVSGWPKRFAENTQLQLQVHFHVIQCWDEWRSILCGFCMIAFCFYVLIYVPEMPRDRLIYYLAVLVIVGRRLLFLGSNSTTEIIVNEMLSKPKVNSIV